MKMTKEDKPNETHIDSLENQIGKLIKEEKKYTRVVALMEELDDLLGIYGLSAQNYTRKLEQIKENRDKLEKELQKAKGG